MILYRLYLGGKRGSEIIPQNEIDAFLEQTVNRAPPGYFQSKGDGIWQGAAEPATVLEYLGAQSEEPILYRIGQLYARHFRQESVLMLKQSVGAEFIRSPGVFTGASLQPPPGQFVLSRIRVGDEPESSAGASTI
jgi:hypothetical protein